MAENVEGHRGRRGRWLVLAVVVAIAAWVVRSQRATRADYGEEWQLPEPPAPAPRPAPAPQAAPAAAEAPRPRPSPRPRPAPAS
ncbi:MAG TPA: hypothetical protein VKZ81_03590 [Pseudonocardia sp.]|uniref:hypothetical protein n=1 Tax=Pseudonocardia sp. TaxID=60912 RepID=UPI002B4B7705|nr:hypothetical protein [Pseudonocardia sp.]HLU54521.1 hypothetical protein [Pseudonocardia sp.]